MKHLAYLRFLSALVLPGLACGAAPDSTQRLAAAGPPSSPPPAAAPLATGGPARIPLTVRETAGVARQGEVASAGIPLPRSLGLRDPRGLAVVDPAGRPVPADFRVLARWHAGLAEANAPVQWLLVSFPATVGARQSAVYSLVTDGSAGAGPAPPRPLKLTRDGDRVVVDTGAAVFRLGGSPGALFDEVRLVGGGPGGTRLVAGSELSLTVQGKTGNHPKVRRMWIEHAGPLTAAVVVDGAYDLPPVGKGGFGSRRRYVFTAGSPTAVVRHAVAWEGNLACQGCIQVEKNGPPNGVLVERARDTLALDLDAMGSAPAVDVTAVGDFQAQAIQARGETGSGEIARVRQRLRPNRKSPLAFEAEAAGKKAAGDKADGGMLAAGGPGGTVAVAIRQMHRYEPQALRLLGDGRLTLDLADDRVWLAHHQGLFATFAIAALPARPARADLDRLVWAPLNSPLRGWPDAAWLSASEAVGEIPAGPLPKRLAAYDKLIPSVLERTVEQVDEEGLAGLMTFGLYPRYWGRWDSPELECKKDPTPNEAWDNLFWCSTWTDYHNTLATSVLWAMRSGGVEWLDDLAVPGALRMLHTQIMQCGPDEAWFYCGQAPAGYAAYRSDFNSSHAYFDNLFLYYWLTGDSTVVDTLRRGGESMRRWMCESRGPQPVADPRGPDGPACPADQPPTRAKFTGRVAAQWIAVFRFLGLASEDASFREDYRSAVSRMVTHNYAELQRDGRSYGFLGDAPVREPGQYKTGQIWMNAFYDAETLHRFRVDSGDEAVGDPPLRPSRVLAAVARTLVDIEPRMQQKKLSLREPWPQHLTYTSEGPRIGGRLVAVVAKGRDLFGPEKASMTALLVREGQATGDRSMIEAGEEIVHFVLSAAEGEQVPLGKLQGQYLTRLHAAVARLAGAPSPQR
ncbi:MAG TPA: hypothetical protein VF756_27040 [Thermoanaerobaculia bacterium]